MKKFFPQFLMLAASSMLAVALAPSALSQQADQDPSPSPAPNHQPETATPPQQNEAQMPASGDFTTHETKVFNGRITKENGNIVLKDPVTKVTYKLNDPSKAKQYVGKQVKVSGKLDLNTNTIQMENIEPTS